MSAKNKVCGSTFFILTIILLLTEGLLAISHLNSESEQDKGNSSTTFKVWEDKVPEKYIIQTLAKTPNEVLEQVSSLQFKTFEVLQSTKFSGTTFASGNGFVDAVVNAYRGHHNLIIRPDDVWAAIMTQFSFYLNENAEKFRKQFVNFEEKKELVVQLPGTLRTAPYHIFVERMTEKIDENLVDPKVKEWILPNFSTTTENDRLSIGVMFMASMKKYFSYTGAIICGIPSITLEGSVEDWKDIQGRLGKLQEFELSEWYDMLHPILEQFVAAKEGNVDVPFWKRICRVKEIYGGCAVERQLSGWITAFAAFTSQGQRQVTFAEYALNKNETSPWPIIDVNSIPSGVVTVDVKILDQGVPFNATLVAGHMAIETKDHDVTLKPLIGWALVIVEKEGELGV